MKKTDLLWILAYPIYQLVGTFRHEASHALVAILEGATITEFVFWPTKGYWGYVRWEGSVSAATTAAPYLCDLLTFVLFFSICMLVRFDRRWLWVNFIAIGIISPLVNSIHNYRMGLGGSHDVGELMEHWTKSPVHGYFWLTISVYLVGLVIVFTLSRTATTQYHATAKPEKNLKP